MPQWLNVWSLTESFPAHACWTRCYKKSKQFNVLALFILRNIQVTETTVSRTPAPAQQQLPLEPNLGSFYKWLLLGYRSLQSWSMNASDNHEESINLHWILGEMTPPFPQTSRVKKGHSFGHGLDISEFKREDGWVGCFYQIILCNFVWTKLPSRLVSIMSLFEIGYFPLCWEKCAQMCKNYLRISQLASLDSWEICWMKSGKRRKTKICLDL